MKKAVELLLEEHNVKENTRALTQIELYTIRTDGAVSKIITSIYTDLLVEPFRFF